MSYNVHNFEDGQILHAAPLNEMDEQINQNKDTLTELSDSIFDDNSLYYSEEETVEGTGTYVYKDIFIDDIESGALYTLTVDRVVGALNNQPVFMYFLDADGATIDQSVSTSGVYENIVVYYIAPVNTVRIKIRLYASKSGATTAIYSGIRLVKGAEYQKTLGGDVGTQVVAIVNNQIEQSGALEIAQTECDYGFSVKAENGVETGIGAWYWTSGRPTYNASQTGYTYFIIPVKKNSVYSFSVRPRWMILVDENNARVADEDSINGLMVNTRNAVKFYVTVSNSYINQFEISEGYVANSIVKKSLKAEPKEPSKWGNSLPQDTMYFSIGIDEDLYIDNMLGLLNDYISVVMGTNFQTSRKDTHIEVRPLSAFSSVNGLRITEYNSKLDKVYVPQNTGITIKPLSLQNCSCLVIGDSTVGSWGTMTQEMLDFFTENGKTLTLLGTRGQSATNRHEGRGGWSAYSYCREASHGDYTNPFLNNGHFDFAYYMTQQGYTAPDFVIIQLGINDVSNIGIDEFKDVSEQALAYEKEMIDSIRAYNSNIKIIINPPTMPNSNMDKLSEPYETTVFRNFIVRYGMMLRRLALQYNNNNVRCSNNNLILNTKTEIRDNVHPTDDGFIKMGKEMCNQINCWQN